MRMGNCSYRRAIRSYVMSNPLFIVGEEVILQSKDRPQLNGEYSVDAVSTADKITICRQTGEYYDFIDEDKDSVGYMLYPIILDDEGFEIVWNESALRKKHKPSDQSLEELIKGLNQEVVAL